MLLSSLLKKINLFKCGEHWELSEITTGKGSIAPNAPQLKALATVVATVAVTLQPYSRHSGRPQLWNMSGLQSFNKYAQTTLKWI
jgi:hypothetical protein